MQMSLCTRILFQEQEAKQRKLNYFLRLHDHVLVAYTQHLQMFTAGTLRSQTRVILYSSSVHKPISASRATVTAEARILPASSGKLVGSGMTSTGILCTLRLNQVM
jgi:hypothetical protein